VILSFLKTSFISYKFEHWVITIPSSFLFYILSFYVIFSLCVYYHYYKICPYSIWHSTQHSSRKTPFHPCGFLMEIMSGLKPMARCPLWFTHTPLPSIQIHQFPLKSHYESTKSLIQNPLIIHYEHIQVDMVHSTTTS
jgi:hypothetical protein